MSRFASVGFVALFALVGGLYGWARLRAEWGAANPPPPPALIETTSHRVTPEMEQAGDRMKDRPAPPFDAATADGSRLRLADIRSRGPVVLTFIKDGCPCSEAAQRYFNRVRDAYPQAQFVGIFDRPAEPARQWAERFHVDYPLLLAPDLDLMRAYQAGNSAYVVLIDPEGRIRRYWPGYSETMLRDLGAELARMTGTPEQPLRFADAPEDEYTGCPFDL